MSPCRARPITFFVLAIFAAWVSGASPANGGGADWFEPVEARSEPGDTIMVVGYTSAAVPAAHADLPVTVTLQEYDAGAPDGRRLPTVVETTSITPTGRTDDATRVALTFIVPADVDPGDYWLDYCVGPGCTNFGYLEGPILYIGVDPPRGAYDSRLWPLGEPEIMNLDPDVAHVGPYDEGIRAGDVQKFRGGLDAMVRSIAVA